MLKTPKDFISSSDLLPNLSLSLSVYSKDQENAHQMVGLQ